MQVQREQFMEMLKTKLGFNERETKNILTNIENMASMITMADFVMRDINVQALRSLNDIVIRAKEKLSKSDDPALRDAAAMAVLADTDKNDRLEMLCDFAEKYQARFGKDGGLEDEPVAAINAFTSKPVAA